MNEFIDGVVRFFKGLELMSLHLWREFDGIVFRNTGMDLNVTHVILVLLLVLAVILLTRWVTLGRLNVE